MGARGTWRRMGKVLGLVLCAPLAGGCFPPPKKHVTARPSAAMPEAAPVRLPQEGEVLLTAERRGAQFVVRAGRAEHCMGASSEPFELEVSHQVEEEVVFLPSFCSSCGIQPVDYVVLTGATLTVRAPAKTYVLQSGQRKTSRCDRPLTSTVVLLSFDTGAELRDVTDDKGALRFSLPSGAGPRGTFAIKIAGRRPAVFAYGHEDLRRSPRVALKEVTDPSITDLHQPAEAGANAIESESERGPSVTADSDARSARSDPHAVRLFHFELSDVDAPPEPEPAATTDE